MVNLCSLKLYPSVLADKVLSPSSNTTPLHSAVMLGLGLCQLPLLCQWNSSSLLPIVGRGGTWEGWRREEGHAFPASIILVMLLQTDSCNWSWKQLASCAGSSSPLEPSCHLRDISTGQHVFPEVLVPKVSAAGGQRISSEMWVPGLQDLTCKSPSSNNSSLPSLAHPGSRKGSFLQLEFLYALRVHFLLS